MKVPAALHEVLGESPRIGDVAAMVLFGTVVGAALATSGLTSTLPVWKAGLATLLAADIGAGCVANFSDSTNDYYARRPRHRWVFIAIHVHVLLLAWLLGVGWTAALWTWLLTLASAGIVNALSGHPSQRLVGGLLLGIGLLALSATDGPAILRAVNALFFVKVAFAFAVDHRASLPR